MIASFVSRPPTSSMNRYTNSSGNCNGNGNDLFYLLWLGSSILLSNHGGLYNWVS